MGQSGWKDIETIDPTAAGLGKTPVQWQGWCDRPDSGASTLPGLSSSNKIKILEVGYHKSNS